MYGGFGSESLWFTKYGGFVSEPLWFTKSISTQKNGIGRQNNFKREQGYGGTGSEGLGRLASPSHMRGDK
jgi:hypothetical protein